MSNVYSNQAKTLAQILANNGLTKVAGQEIKHEEPTNQDSLGAEQQQEIKDNVNGTIASTPAADNKDHAEVKTPPNCENLNKSPEAALASTGTDIKVQTGEGCPAELPKTAADFKKELAFILRKANNRGLQQKEAMEKKAAFERDFRTGTQVMEKLAALNEKSTKEQIAEAQDELMKLASTNQAFQVIRDRILMNKLAEDIDALAAAQGITPEEAAANLDAAAEANPEMMAEAEDEANGEAVAELANAEAETDQLMGGIEELAANASNELGVEVTPDDILDLADQVEAQAQELGVEPEALLQAAMEDIQAAQEVSPEDEANAQAILDQAAEAGLSPEEVIQIASDMMEGGAPAEGGEAPATTDGGEATAPNGEAAAPAEGGESGESEGGEESKSEDGGEDKKEDEGEEKTASVKQASTRRAEFVNQLMNQMKTTKAAKTTKA